MVAINKDEWAQIRANQHTMMLDDYTERLARKKELEEGTLRKTIHKGDILAARYTYGGETLLYDFYRVENITEKTIRLVKLQKEYKYQGEPPYYYDTPEWVYPNGEIACEEQWDNKKEAYVCKPFIIARKLFVDKYTGEQYCKPDAYHDARLWSGRPLANYNWH